MSDNYKTNIKNTLLLIDDNRDDFIIFQRLISDDFSIEYSDGTGDIVQEIKDLHPICILLDYNLGLVSGIDLLNTIKADSEISYISVIMLTNESNPEVIVQCMKSDAANYLIKDSLDRTRLDLTIRKAVYESHLNLKVQEQQEEIARLTREDELTGILNRRYFIERLEEEIKKSGRGTGFLIFALADLDCFKKVNDVLGHLTGDEILRIVGRELKSSFRTTDLVGRYGGDEFFITLIEGKSDYSPKVISEHLQKINSVRKSITRKLQSYLIETCRELNIDPVESGLQVSLSVGVTICFKESNGFKDLFEEADKALYYVKERGRDNLAYLDLQSDGVKMIDQD